jgi:hypothetical protein
VPEGDPSVPTTVCPNGNVVVLYSPKQYPLDEHGHVTPDETAKPPPGIPDTDLLPCQLTPPR